MSLELTCDAFQEGDTIPKKYTGDGQNVSPLLQWQNATAGTRSFALLCEDPDAPRGTFTHWVLFNLPAECRELSEGIPNEPNLPDGSRQGKNDFDGIGYGGPAPPRGKPHRYVFKIHALDQELNVPGGASKNEVLAAMKGHVLAEDQWMGTYGR
jgi:hypothetical protein